MNHHRTYPQYWINHLSYLLRAKVAEAFQAAGIDASAEDWALLLILSDEGPQTPSALAEQTMRDRPAVSRKIAKLEAQGILARSIADTDRRSQVISLTPEGQATFERWRGVVMPIVARCGAQISEAEMQTTLSVLERMTRNLTEGDNA